MEALGVGSVLGDRFELLAPLGAGGMGTVYRARDRQLDVLVALKVLRLGQDEHAVRRFHAEVRLARLVKHPNVCSVHEYGQHDGVVYCAMELVEGRNLHKLLRDKALPWDRAYAIALEIAEGLGAIHQAGVVHRDLKSSNIMIDVEGRVRLVDFGIARTQPGRAGHPEDVGLTDDRQVVGSPEYMSPEQVRHDELDARSDIYSFGIVLFELFTGQPPFRADNAYEVMTLHLRQAPPLDGAVLGALPEPLVPVLRKALAKEPSERWQSATELIAALREARAGLSGTEALTPPPSERRTWTLPGSTGRIWRLAGGVRAVAVVLVVFALAAGAVQLARVGREAAAPLAVPSPTPPQPSATPVGVPPAGASAVLRGDPDRPSPPRAGVTPPVPRDVARASRSSVARAAAPRSTEFDAATLDEVAAGATPSETATRGATHDGPTTTTTTPPTQPAPTLPAEPAFPQGSPAVAPLVAPASVAAAPAEARVPPPPAVRRGDRLREDDPDVVRAECADRSVRLSSQADRLGARGSVLVEYVVDENGRVPEARVLKSDDPALTRSVLDSVKRWRCRPATKHGVEGRMTLRIKLEIHGR